MANTKYSTLNICHEVRVVEQGTTAPLPQLLTLKAALFKYANNNVLIK